MPPGAPVPAGRKAIWLAFAAWLASGIFIALLTPKGVPLSAEGAEKLYGAARSMRSAAPEGLLALAQTLTRLGFRVGAHHSASRPDAEALVLLSPSVRLSLEERQALLAWVRQGGRLLYAPARAKSAAPGEPVSVPARESCQIDALCSELLGPGVLDSASDVLAAPLGEGRVVVLANGGSSLSNAALQTQGLSGHAGWLRVWLAGVESVNFDEARIGVAGSDGLWDLLRGSRFWPGALVFFSGLALFLLASGTRRAPALAEPGAGSRDFGEHLDAIGELLGRDARAALARELLGEGTRRRLGPRTARAELEAALAEPLELAPLAARLIQLEAGKGSPGA